jgi:hypothetical protein
MNASVEGQKHILEDFILNELFPILAKDGVWVAPNPAPLTCEEVTAIFKRVAEHDSYDRQLLATATIDGRVVTLMNGIVHDEREPVDGRAPHIFERGS